MNGNNIIIIKDGVAIAGTRSQRVQTKCETIEVSGPQSGNWVERIASRKDWDITVNKLVTQAQDIYELLSVGDTVTLIIRDRSNSAAIIGTAIVEACDQEFRKGSLVQGNFKFAGSGELKPFVKVTSITVTADTQNLTVGDTLQLTATVLPANATNKTLHYESTSDLTATVTQNGLVTAVGRGEPSIMVLATDGSGVEGSIRLYITEQE